MMEEIIKLLKEQLNLAVIISGKTYCYEDGGQCKKDLERMQFRLDQVQHLLSMTIKDS